MKKHYEKMFMTPLSFTFEGRILNDSIVDTAVVTTKSTGQEVNPVDFSSEGNPFNTDWE